MQIREFAAITTAIVLIPAMPLLLLLFITITGCQPTYSVKFSKYFRFYKQECQIPQIKVQESLEILISDKQ